ncbi:hypothetical protein Fuma_00009 [Fuerstiella marisgermanici]|uniref:Uncharacterized protein n=1 Tax=Fuerstiella marisgermanici TaxID=1891926 RepID=A0A1P8W8Q0_9PLAN|nr:hypothetical protein Fuma_00009 [Fuerstiella marisgermanici]
MGLSRIRTQVPSANNSVHLLRPLGGNTRTAFLHAVLTFRGSELGLEFVLFLWDSRLQYSTSVFLAEHTLRVRSDRAVGYS